MGRRVRAGAGATTRSTTSGPGPTGPAPTSASTRSTWCSCTARRPRCSPPTPSTTPWTPWSQEKRIAAYGVSVETADEALAAIARPGVASVQIILNALRLKPLERVLPAARRGRRRHHRPGAAGQRPALRPVRRAHHVRGRRPPQLQPARRGVRRRRDVLRRRLRHRPGGGTPAAPAGARRAPRWPSSRCAGSSTSRASPWSSRAPATRSRPAANAAAADLAPLPAGDLAGGPGRLRRADPPAGARPLVSEPALNGWLLG